MPLAAVTVCARHVGNPLGSSRHTYTPASAMLPGPLIVPLTCARAVSIAELSNGFQFDEIAPEEGCCENCAITARPSDKVGAPASTGLTVRFARVGIWSRDLALACSRI